MKNSLLAGTFLASALLFGAAANAQTSGAPAPASAPEASDEDTGGIQDIVVTARVADFLPCVAP